VIELPYYDAARTKSLGLLALAGAAARRGTGACKIDAARAAIETRFVATTASGRAIDSDYHIDRERQFDLTRLSGLPSPMHDGLIPNFQSEGVSREFKG
jgi:hypothetical protein